MKTYRIKNWNVHFENNKTRVIDNLRWVPVPNKHDGEGFLTIMEQEDGLVIYGCWHLILQVASKCRERGLLVRDDGTPHTAKSIALKSGCRQVSAIVRALEFCASEQVGWIEVFEGDKAIPPVPISERVADAPEDRWSLEDVLNAAQSPDVSVSKAMATECFDHYASQGWVNAAGNPVAGTLNQLKSLLRKWKVKQPSMGKTDAPGTGTPIAKKKESFDDMVTELCQRLVEHGDDQEGFRRTCKAWADKSRDMGKVGGLDVVGTALDILKRRKSK